jgi:tetratricopeptide (TPR) repeat protein
MVPVVALALVAGILPGLRGRPPECDVLPGEPSANVWERAKVPQLRRYCDLVASASAKLTPGSRLVADVVRLADEADALVPGHAAPMLLKGRALAQLSRHAEALDALRLARARDVRALDDPAALLAWARALAFTGAAGEAREAYRALLPRAEILTLADRGAAYLGAGVLAMDAGPAGLDDAVAILRQGRQDSQDLLRAATTFFLALALDRAGEAAEAAAVLADERAHEAESVMDDARVREALGRGGVAEVHAVEALAAAADGQAEHARALWRKYASETPHGPWAAHAMSHSGAHAGARAAAGATARPR